MRRFTPVRALVAAALVSLPGVTMAHANAPDADPKHTNRLVDETSPYLLQHAHNPVDWRPWGPDAFEEARRRDVPIFLSIGYSTCYWCHVMERESFEDEATAAIMNERFVCVKVDREERPDVDDIYMASVQILTGRGGWPMSVFLTPPGARAEDDPGLEPIYAGTYFPTPQFQSLLTNVSDAWGDRRPDILEQSAQITDALRQHFRAEAEPVRLDATPVGTAVSLLVTRLYDEQQGGFGDAPKFPQPVYLEFLLDAADHIEDETFSDRTHNAIRHTLDRMATGGMYDQVGGGFHRYSTDAQWLVPHFEKMLYDNGQLASVYAKAGRRYDDPYYRRIAAEVCEYVLAEMTDPDTGAFYSAQDAEVDHREGLNYLWTRAQFDEVLDPEQATFAARIYGVDRGTNFQDPHHPDDPPANVLFLIDRPDRLATELDMSIEAFEEARRGVDARLLDARNRRKQPHRDDKTLVAWNGLMIRGMADAGRLLGEPRYVNAAGRAADFILDAMSDGDGGLLRAYRDGEARIPGFLEDYAMFIDGLISLHRAQQAMRTPASRSLDAAIRLADAARARFSDPHSPGLWYDTLDGQTDLIIRSRSTYDGATPSGGSVMLNVLISLNEITGDRRHLRHAIDLLGGLGRPIAESPVGPIDATRALHRILQLDADLLSEFADQPDARERDLPVKVFASTERVGVGEGAPGELIVELRIDDDFHITSHDPGVEGLTPLAVNVTNGTGAQVKVDYPKGEALQGAAFADEAPLVHEGVVRLTIRIERSDEDWSGRPLIILTYQACTDEICLAPVTVELDVAIDRR